MGSNQISNRFEGGVKMDADQVTILARTSNLISAVKADTGECRLTFSEMPAESEYVLDLSSEDFDQEGATFGTHTYELFPPNEMIIHGYNSGGAHQDIGFSLMILRVSSTDGT